MHARQLLESFSKQNEDASQDHKQARLPKFSTNSNARQDKRVFGNDDNVRPCRPSPFLAHDTGSAQESCGARTWCLSGLGVRTETHLLVPQKSRHDQLRPWLHQSQKLKWKRPARTARATAPASNDAKEKSGEKRIKVGLRQYVVGVHAILQSSRANSSVYTVAGFRSSCKHVMLWFNLIWMPIFDEQSWSYYQGFGSKGISNGSIQTGDPNNTFISVSVGLQTECLVWSSLPGQHG
jgi:hypothetical protein